MSVMTSAPSRAPESDKVAAVARLLRVGAGGRPLGAHVRWVADHFGVSTRSVYRWLQDPDLCAAARGERSPQRAGRERFEVSVVELAVLGQEQSARAAWESMRQQDLVSCGYSTFTRALRERTDPALVAAAVDGYKGLVNNRLYLMYDPPHRNHTFHLDHTQLDMWVWPSHRHAAPVRPEVTVVVDGYSGLVHAVPWTGAVNGDMVAAALAEATVERTYHGVQVGGQPEQVILDNAASHFGPTMRAGVERFGWILAPTAAYSSWQNGKAERALGALIQRLCKRAPGATNAGTVKTGAQRHVAPRIKDIKPDEVWSWTAFCAALQETVDWLNTECPQERRGGMTRLQAYDADPTERRPLTPEEARLGMLSSDGRAYKATKNGLQFRNVHYVSSRMTYGRSYVVRHLPTVTDFIELFDVATGEYIGRAEPADRLSPQERGRFLNARGRQEREARAIEEGVRRYRRHRAQVDNLMYEDPTDDGELSPSDERPAAPEDVPAPEGVQPNSPTDSNLAAETAAIPLREDLPRWNGTAPVPTTGRGARGRTHLPRVPHPDRVRTRADAEALARENDFLAEIPGDPLTNINTERKAPE